MLSAIRKKVLMIFTTNIENVNLVLLKEVQNVSLKTKIKNQIKKNYIMKKIKVCYLQSLKEVNRIKNMK